MNISSKQILKKINCKDLSLYKGDGYWYFVYDKPENNIFETYSVPCMYLNQMPVDMWISDGLEFVKSIENKG